MSNASSPDPSRREPAVSLPGKVVVTLRAGAMLAIANIVCVVILSATWSKVRAAPKTIRVTGSAKKIIQSDLIVWRANVSVSHADLVQGFEALKAATDRTLAYLKKEGIPETETTVASIATKKHYVRDAEGNPTDKVSSFELVQTVVVESPNVHHVAAVERKVTELIKEGVLLESVPPKYLYTKLAELKIAMLAEATKDARTRAEQIAENSGARLGPVRDADMGVLQIHPRHSDDVSDYGVNDTSSYEKEVAAVVHATFALE